MEFLDEDARPRFIFQSKPPPPSSTDPRSPNQTQLNKPFLFLTVSFSSLLLIFSIFYVQAEPFKCLLFWVSLSFLVGPFAPSRLTGGDVRVGQGPILEASAEEEEEEEKPEILTEKRSARKRSKQIRSDETVIAANIVSPLVETANGPSGKVKRSELSGATGHGSVAGHEGEKEWSEEDLGLLKKQMSKNPVGKPGRWEVISEAFNGRHKVESVIKKAKELGEMKLGDSGGGDYERFLKNRKPLDVTVQEEIGELGRGESGGGGAGTGMGWSASEDIALLNALKAFPKDVAMRWEKIAAAVPGKSKAACVKRVAELKRDFRSSKANAETES